MGNVLRVFARDVLRLFKAPAALVVVVVLVCLPSFYTWFNVIGFWDPYDNTGNLRVCVVNEDEGVDTDSVGALNVGSQIVEHIKSDTQLGWTFVDRDTAMEEVRSGKAYAAFVIPQDFSADLATLATGNYQQAHLEYYVNEKSGAVSPKITDTGATTLDETINSTFVSTVSALVADTIETKLSDAESDANASRESISAQFEKAKEAIAGSRASVEGLNETTNTAIAKANDAKETLAAAKRDIDSMADQLKLVSGLTVTTQNDLGRLSSEIFPVLGQGSLLISQAASKTNLSIGTMSGTVSEAQGQVGAAIETGQAAMEQNAAIIEQLRTLQDQLPDTDSNKEVLGQVVTRLENQNAELSQALSDTETVSQDAGNMATSVANASNAVNATVQGMLDSADAYRDALSTATLPSANSGLSQIGSTAGSLAAAVTNQTLLVDQAAMVIDHLVSTLQTTTSALGQTDDLLASLETSIDTVQTDLASLELSSALSSLVGGGTIDASKIADFMLSPTELQTETLYPLNAYGSAMAPLFTNLTLWIGVFMLMVILKQEVDDEGIRNLKAWQRYLGRWLFLAPLAALQAIICCAGNLIIGVQSVNPPLLFLTAIVASLTYLSIQFALSVTMQHIGKGICVILVFVQIPGATGLYPIEMTPSFFQAIYPFFPFTYGINAMRETIAGFYDGQWAYLMSILLVFFVLSFVFALLIRPYLTNLNRMFARQIKDSDILNGEDVQVPARRYRMGQLIQALSDREDYRLRLHRHADSFIRWYPRLKQGAWIFGIAVPTIATVAFSLNQSEKVVVLTVWLVWLVVVLVFLVVVEHIRDSLERRLSLDGLSNDELRTLFSASGGLDEGMSEPSGKNASERSGA